MNTIKIAKGYDRQLDQHLWSATFSDAETKATMGTDTIPTAFTTLVPKQTVIDAIQELNPEYIVS